MRVVKLTLAVASLCLAAAGPALPSPAMNPSCDENSNKISLSTSLDTDGCPAIDAATRQGLITVEPPCLEATHGATWPEITWDDNSQDSQKIGWTLTPGSNPHGHFTSITIPPATNSHPQRSSKASHAAYGSCLWHYTVTAWVADAAGNRRCSATLDPGIKFNPGGGGGSPLTKYWWLIAGGLLLLAYLWWRSRRRTVGGPTSA